RRDHARRGTADRGEYRQAARISAEQLERKHRYIRFTGLYSLLGCTWVHTCAANEIGCAHAPPRRVSSLRCCCARLSRGVRFVPVGAIRIQCSGVGAADRGEYRQAARAFAEAIINHSKAVSLGKPTALPSSPIRAALG